LLSLQGLSFVYRDTGRLPDAIVLQEQIVERHRTQHGLEHHGTVLWMHVLAMTYQKAGRLCDADRMLREALRRGRSDDMNKTPIRTANLMAHLGLNLLKQREYAAAEPLVRESLAIYVAEYPDNWRRFHAYSLLGGSLLGQKKYADAEPLLLQGYEGMKEREAMIFATDRVRLTESVERIVNLYEATHQSEHAELWLDKLATGNRSEK
jgi:hypothetical protein